jgi:hypothetical protein
VRPWRTEVAWRGGNTKIFECRERKKHQRTCGKKLQADRTLLARADTGGLLARAVLVVQVLNNVVALQLASEQRGHRTEGARVAYA